MSRRVMPEAVQIAPPGLDRTNREKWLATRRDSIGGSDISAILGLDPYRSALDIWADKTGMGEARRSAAMDEAAFWGHQHERSIAPVFAQRSGLRLLQPPGVLANVTRPWATATLDWLVTDVPSGRVPMNRKWPLEIKSRSAYQSSDWADGPADSPAIQTAWYLAVTGASKGYIAALIGGNSLRWYEMRRDDELIAMLIEAAEEFRVNHLDAGVPPEPGGRPSTSTLLDSLWMGNPDTFAYLERDITLVRDEALAAAAEAAAAVERREAARNRVKLAMGESEVAFAGGTVFATWHRNGTFRLKDFMRGEPELAVRYGMTKPGIDTKRLAEDHPEVYREYCARVLRFPDADDGGN